MPAAERSRGRHPPSEAMTLFIAKRVGLALITLWILSVIVFFAGQVLPGDPGRAILGPLAAESAVKQLDHQLGVDQPLITQYWDWITSFVRGDMGNSYQFRAPVEPFISSAIGKSLELAAVAFVEGMEGASNRAPATRRRIS